MTRTQKGRTGVSRGKIVLIGALALLLYLVIMVQIPGKPAPSISKTEPRPVTTKTVANKKIAEKPSKNLIAANETVAPPPKPKVWKSVGLADAIEHNPFVLPATLRATKPEPVEQAGQCNKIGPAEVARREKIKQQALEREARQLQQEEQEKKIAEQLIAYKRNVALEQERIEQLIASIQKKGFDMVFSNSKTRMVKWGNLLLKENDEFEGVKVVEIRDDGRVILESTFQPKPFSPSIGN